MSAIFDLLKKFDTDSVVLLSFLRLFRTAIYSISYLFMAKKFAVEEIGLFNFNLTIAAFCSILVGFGLKPLATNLFSKYPAALSSHLIKLAFLKLLSASMLVVALYIVIVVFHLQSISVLILALIILMPIANLDFLFELTGVKRSTYFKFQLCLIMLTFAARLSCIYLFNDIYLVLLTYIFEALLTAVGVIILLGDSKKVVCGGYRTLKIMIYRSLPLLFVSFLTIAVWRIDQFFLLALSSSADVGVQSTLIMVYDACILLFVSNANGVFSTYSRNRQHLPFAFVKKILLLSIKVLPFLIVGAMSLAFILGGYYLTALASVWVYSGVFLVHCYGYAFERLLIVTKNNRRIVMNHMSILVLNSALNFLLIPKYGILGSAIATLASLLIVYSLSSFLNYRSVYER